MLTLKEAKEQGYIKSIRNKTFGRIGNSKYYWNIYYKVKDLAQLKLRTLNPFVSPDERESFGEPSVSFFFDTIGDKFCVFANVKGTNVNQLFVNDIKISNPIEADNGFNFIEVFTKADLNEAKSKAVKRVIDYLDNSSIGIDKEECLKYFVNERARNSKENTLRKLIPIMKENKIPVPSVKPDSYDNVTFNITCTMKERWVPCFCALLKTMQEFGEAGHSGALAFYADGDGDFRPKFDIEVGFDLKEELRTAPKNGSIKTDVFFDAG